MSADTLDETISIHDESTHLVRLFGYEHLPAHLQEVSKPFAVLARQVFALPVSFERTAALRKLLEAKDCAVRAMAAE